MASNFNLAEATSQPTQTTISSNTVNINRIPSPTKDRDFLYSISRAMKYAEFLIIGARDVDGALVKNSLPMPNSVSKIPTDLELLEEFTNINNIRGLDNTMTFQEYKSFRSPGSSSSTFRSMIRGMGLVDETTTLDGDVIGPEDI
jgi:hypothetical protein